MVHPKELAVQVYCPLCEDCYCPRSKYHDNIDGAFFGTTFPHLLLMTYPQLQPEAPADLYVPRVFGFKLSSAAPGRSQGGSSSGRKQIVSPSSLMGGEERAGLPPTLLSLVLAFSMLFSKGLSVLLKAH